MNEFINAKYQWNNELLKQLNMKPTSRLSGTNTNKFNFINMWVPCLPTGRHHTKVGTCYSWTDSSTLEITARFVEESLGSQVIVCKFSEINGSMGVTIGPKAAPLQMGPPGRVQPAILLRGVLVNLE